MGETHGKPHGECDLFVYVFIYLFMCLFIYFSIYLYIYIYIHAGFSARVFYVEANDEISPKISGQTNFAMMVLGSIITGLMEV